MMETKKNKKALIQNLITKTLEKRLNELDNKEKIHKKNIKTLKQHFHEIQQNFNLCTNLIQEETTTHFRTRSLIKSMTKTSQISSDSPLAKTPEKTFKPVNIVFNNQFTKQKPKFINISPIITKQYKFNSSNILNELKQKKLSKSPVPKTILPKIHLTIDNGSSTSNVSTKLFRDFSSNFNAIGGSSKNQTTIQFPRKLKEKQTINAASFENGGRVTQSAMGTGNNFNEKDKDFKNFKESFKEFKEFDDFNSKNKVQNNQNNYIHIQQNLTQNNKNAVDGRKFSILDIQATLPINNFIEDNNLNPFTPKKVKKNSRFVKDFGELRTNKQKALFIFVKSE